MGLKCEVFSIDCEHLSLEAVLWESYDNNSGNSTTRGYSMLNGFPEPGGKSVLGL